MNQSIHVTKNSKMLDVKLYKRHALKEHVAKREAQRAIKLG